MMRNDDIKGLDVVKGMALVGKNKMVYTRLLKSFIGNDFCNQLLAAVESGDTEQVRQKAHSLKGVAGNMHMEGLFNLSREIEAAAKEGLNLTPAHELITQIIEMNSVTINSINMILENPNILDEIS